MADIYFPDYPEKLNPVANDLGLLADSEDLDVDGNPKFKRYKLGNQDIDINVTENTLSMGGNSNNIVDSAITQDATKITIPRSTYIPGAVDRIMLFGTTEATASPANTIFEYIGDIAVMPNLDQSVRFFLNDQEIRVDTFNDTAAGEPRVVVAKFRGTVQNQLPLEINDVCGTLEIAGRMSDYPRALFMIRTIIKGAEENGYMPTETVFYNRKIDGMVDTRPDEAGKINEYNDLVWGTATIAADTFLRAKFHVKGDASGFVKFGIKEQVGVNPHDEHLIYYTDTNSERGDGFVYGNQYDGWIVRSGNAIFRSQGGSAGACGRNASQGTAGVLQPNRMTTAQRDALAGLQGGDMIFNTTTGKHQGWDGSSWNDMY